MGSLTTSLIEGQYFSAHCISIQPWDQVSMLTILVVGDSGNVVDGVGYVFGIDLDVAERVV